MIKKMMMMMMTMMMITSTTLSSQQTNNNLRTPSISQSVSLSLSLPLFVYLSNPLTPLPPSLPYLSQFLSPSSLSPSFSSHLIMPPYTWAKWPLILKLSHRATPPTAKSYHHYHYHPPRSVPAIFSGADGRPGTAEGIPSALPQASSARLH